MSKAFERFRLAPVTISVVVALAAAIPACGESRTPCTGTACAPTSTSGASSSGQPGECETAEDCGSGGDGCTTWSCQRHACVSENAPSGSVPVNPTATAPVCKQLLCDGKGGLSIVPDPTAVPPQGAAGPCQKASCDANGDVVTMPDPTAAPPPDETRGDCQRPSCDASGNVVQVPDPTDAPPVVPGTCEKPVCQNGVAGVAADPSNVPSQTSGDCKTTGCDANGNIVYTPDPSDVPAITPGTCMMPSCDAAGNVVMAPDDKNPPPPGVCTSYTCSNGQPVSQPANVGKNCSSEGYVCSAQGMCNVCPPVDAQCTDPGPGAAAHSLSTAYNFGSVGICDSDVFGDCGALTANTTSYFTTKTDSSFSLCDYNPYVNVQASAPVTLCEYFECASVTCPLPSLPSSLGGNPGCCITGAATEMAVVPASCSDPTAFITVASSSAACTTYQMSFHF